MRLKLALASAVLVITTVTSEALASPRPPVDRLVAEALAQVRRGLNLLCEPECGKVAFEPSPETQSAALEHVSVHDSRMLYNRGFITRVARRYGAPAVYGIVAHEYGHHLDNLPGAPQWTRELRADATAGCALARGGIPTEPLLSWMRHEHLDAIWNRLHPDETDPNQVLARFVAGHPPWIDRIGALKRGVAVCSVGDGALALHELLDRTGTYTVEFSPSFAEQPFTVGSKLSLKANVQLTPLTWSSVRLFVSQ